MVSRRWLYFGGFIFSMILLVGTTLMGVVEALSVLAGQTVPSGEFILLAMLGAAAEWFVASIVLGLFAFVFLIATVVSVLRNLSVPRDDRLVSIVERLEREFPVLQEFEVSEKVEPTTEDRKQELKDQYVAGEINDREFEREMERLMDDDSSTTGGQSETTTALERER